MQFQEDNDKTYHRGKDRLKEMNGENIDKKTWQKGKYIGRMIFAVCVLSLVAFACYIGYDYVQLQNKYQEVWDVQISREEIDNKQVTIANLEKKLANLETELITTGELITVKEQLLAQGTGTEQQKEQLLSVYEQNVKLVEEAKLLVLEGLGYEVPAYYASEDYENDWRNNVIGDLAGNSLISEGIVGGLDAAEAELSFDNIVSGVKEGIANGVPSFTTDTLTEILAGDTGSGVLGAASLITDVLTVNDVPEIIANALIYAQERYSAYLHNFVADEQVTTEDIRWAADSYYQVYQIAEQLAVVTGGQSVNASEAEEIYARLKELAEEYQANNEYLLLYTGETAE